MDWDVSNGLTTQMGCHAGDRVVLRCGGWYWYEVLMVKCGELRCTGVVRSIDGMESSRLERVYPGDTVEFDRYNVFRVVP